MLARGSDGHTDVMRPERCSPGQAIWPHLPGWDLSNWLQPKLGGRGPRDPLPRRTEASSGRLAQPRHWQSVQTSSGPPLSSPQRLFIRAWDSTLQSAEPSERAALLSPQETAQGDRMTARTRRDSKPGPFDSKFTTSQRLSFINSSPSLFLSVSR